MINQRFLGRLITFGTPKQHETIMFQQHSKEESRIPWSFLGLFPISIPGKTRCRLYSVTHFLSVARPWKSWSMIPKSLRIRLKLGLVDPGGMDLSEIFSPLYLSIQVHHDSSIFCIINMGYCIYTYCGTMLMKYL